MGVGGALFASPDFEELVQPGVRALDDPTVPAQAAAMFGAPSG